MRLSGGVTCCCVATGGEGGPGVFRDALPAFKQLADVALQRGHALTLHRAGLHQPMLHAAFSAGVRDQGGCGNRNCAALHRHMNEDARAVQVHHSHKSSKMDSVQTEFSRARRDMACTHMRSTVQRAQQTLTIHTAAPPRGSVPPRCGAAAAFAARPQSPAPPPQHAAARPPLRPPSPQVPAYPRAPASHAPKPPAPRAVPPAAPAHVAAS